MIYQNTKTIHMTPPITVARLDWTIAVLSDGQDITIMPMWRRPGSGWMTPADLPGPVPGAVLSVLLDAENLLTLARAVETEQARRKLVP